MVLAVAAIVWLAIDLLRSWTPLLITVFGRAAQTPAELIGAFALGVTAVPLALLLFPGERLTRGRAPLWTVIALALGARWAIHALAGTPLLVVSSIGVAAALIALALTAARAGEAFGAGLVTGIAGATVTHATLGTWAAIWRLDAPGLLITVLLTGLVVTAGAALGEATGPAPVRIAWLALPILLLAGITLANPARALVAHPAGSGVVAAAATVAALLATRRWSRMTRTAAALGVVLATAATMLPDPLAGWVLFGFAVGMPCLSIVVTLPPTLAPGPTRGHGVRVARALAGGALLFTVVLFAFYAGYDMGYRADWLVVAVAFVLALVLVVAPAVTPTSANPEGADPTSADPTSADPTGRAVAPTSVAVRGTALTAAVLAVLVAALGPVLTVRPPAGASAEASEDLTLAAYNVRMGFGIDGTFAPERVADLLRTQGADVVLLSEVDRGWLLNGGQDQLTVLARLLDADVAFGPAGDQVWGDAILSRHPLSDVRARRLPAYDSLTGAQVLAATLTLPSGARVRVLSTHVQPDADGPDPTLRQAEDIVAFTTAEQRRTGLPVVLGGDFNFEPGSRSWAAVTDAGLIDALAAARPLLTSSSDDLREEIDHVFVSAGLRADNARTVLTGLSDHLPVLVDIAPGR